MKCPDNYITRLGICFYGREKELEILEKIFSGEYDPSLLIVYGPRRVGKSELLRYFTTTRSKKFRKVYSIYFDVKDRVGKILLGSIGVSVYGSSKTSADKILNLIKSLPEASLSTLGSIAQALLEIADVGRDIARSLKISRYSKIFIIADEFHELSGYSGSSVADRLKDLRTIASSISGTFNSEIPWSRIRAIVTVSEGYVFARDEENKYLWQRLMGYRADYLFVGEMDPKSFSDVLKNYCSLKKYDEDKCRELEELVISIAGRLPGWISDIDYYIKNNMLVDKVRENIKEFQDMMRETALRHDLDLKTLAKKLYEAFTSGKDFSDLGIEPSLLDDLIKMNIVYRFPEKIYGLIGRALKPQIRLYETAIKLFAEGRSIDISSKEDLIKILREN